MKSAGPSTAINKIMNRRSLGRTSIQQEEEPPSKIIKGTSLPLRREL
jgi:hypothetical protein